jgi:hypothetical protein
MHLKNTTYDGLGHGTADAGAASRTEKDLSLKYIRLEDRCRIDNGCEAGRGRGHIV